MTLGAHFIYLIIVNEWNSCIMRYNKNSILPLTSLLMLVWVTEIYYFARATSENLRWLNVVTHQLTNFYLRNSSLSPHNRANCRLCGASIITKTSRVPGFVEPPTFWTSSVSAIIFYITHCHLSNSVSQKTKNSSLSFFFSTLVCTWPRLYTWTDIPGIDLGLIHHCRRFAKCLRTSIH